MFNTLCYEMELVLSLSAPLDSSSENFRTLYIFFPLGKTTGRSICFRLACTPYPNGWPTLDCTHLNSIMTECLQVGVYRITLSETRFDQNRLVIYTSCFPVVEHGKFHNANRFQSCARWDAITICIQMNCIRYNV